MISGDLSVHSVHEITGEEVVNGELRRDGARPIPFASVRGESVRSLAPELAGEIERQVRGFDRQHGFPVKAFFRIVSGNATVEQVTLAALWPAAHVRMLVERVRDGRLDRDAALAHLTLPILEGAGMYVVRDASAAPIATGLAASPGVAFGRLALPDDVTVASDEDPRVLVIDDASPEDAAAIHRAAAIIATSGGLTADAAIAARALRKPCVVSTSLRIGTPGQPARGEWVTVDGTRGSVLVGRLPLMWAPSTPAATELYGWLAPQPEETLSQTLDRALGAKAQADRR